MTTPVPGTPGQLYRRAIVTRLLDSSPDTDPDWVPFAKAVLAKLLLEAEQVDAKCHQLLQEQDPNTEQK